MRLWNTKRYRKPRPASRVSTLFSTPVMYDIGDDHAFSTSSNGYGPQVISNTGFRPNNLVPRSSENEVVEERSSSDRPESPVSNSSSSKRKHLGPWSPSTVGGPNSTDVSTNHLGHERQPVSGANHDGLWSWIPHVAQSADDNTVLYRVKEVFLFAEQFVINFYSDRTATSEIPQEVLSKVNRSQLFSNGQLQEYFTKAAFQTSLIKHILISLMLDLISFDLVASQASLLPKEFQNYIALAKARTRSNADEIPHIQPVLSAYRVLSVYIHSNFDSDQIYLDERQRISKETAADFRSAFDQWLEKDKSEEDWQSSFHTLVEKSASLGTFLFSQSSVFFFDWEMTAEDQSARLVPVSPRMLRVFDNDAQFREVSDHVIRMKCGSVFKSTISEVEGNDA